MLHRYIFSLFYKFQKTVSALLVIMISQVMAEESPPTPKLLGHKPAVSNVKIVPDKPKAGESVTASWQYDDVDKDPEGGTTFSWFINDIEMVGQNDKTYKLPQDSGTKTIHVIVTPRSGGSAYPAIGFKQASSKLSILSFYGVCQPNTNQFYGNLLIQRPKAFIDTRSNSVNKCQKIGMRFPTANELVNLRTGAVGSTASTQMCDKYGWPLANKCGGSSFSENNYYWVSESNTAISMYDSSKKLNYTGEANTVCVMTK